MIVTRRISHFKVEVYQNIFCSFAWDCQDVYCQLMFSEEIKELRVRCQLPQRTVASALEIDTATYCKIEKGERKAKEEHLSVISRLLNVSHSYLLSLWLADQISEMLEGHKDIALDTLDIVKKSLSQNGYAQE